VSLSNENWMLEIVLFIFCLVVGLPLAAMFAFFGAICLLLVVTIPFGIGALRMAGYLLWPFGRDVTRDNRIARNRSLVRVAGGVIWILLFSWQVIFIQATAAIILLCTIVGIPLALAYFQAIPFSVWPIGVRVIRPGTLSLSDIL
jgi:uncharacterized membrane protein YccF (DUF307 family)